MSGDVRHVAEARHDLRIGVLGGGQLGRMLALAGVPLGMSFRFLDPSAEAPARDVGDLMVAPFTDEHAIDALAVGLDAATFEFENVPAEIAARLASRVPTSPAPIALTIGQDRLNEKEMFRRLGVGTNAFAAVETREELAGAMEGAVGLPLVLKTRRMGYDGKGQAVCRTREESFAAFEALRPLGSLLAEAFVTFDREVSILAVRGHGGMGESGGAGGTQTRFYPLAQNTHERGILKVSIAPAPDSAGLQAQAERAAAAVLDELNYIGVLAIEFFVKDGVLLANEIAPRVHNSGHWTIEGSVCSQFENHLRAVAGLPLGSTAMREACAAMVNLVGHVPPRRELLAIEGLCVHLYNKPPRPGRKVGHVTVTGSAARVAETLAQLGQLVKWA